MTEERIRAIFREELAAFLRPSNIKTEMTVKEFAQFMHWSLSYTRSKMAEIPHVKVGRRNIILREKAEEYRSRVLSR